MLKGQNQGFKTTNESLSPATQQTYMEKKTKTDAKTRFYTGTASVALFNTISTLIKPYTPHITYWNRPKPAIRI